MQTQTLIIILIIVVASIAATMVILFPHSLIKVLIPMLHVRDYLRQVLPIWLIIAYRCLKLVFTIIAAIALALLLVLTGFALYGNVI